MLQEEGYESIDKGSSFLPTLITVLLVVCLGLIAWIAFPKLFPDPTIKETAAVATPPPPATSAVPATPPPAQPDPPAPPDPCDDFFTRQKQIDGGSAIDIPGAIHEVGVTNGVTNASPEYVALKNCWRNERFSGDRPHFRLGLPYVHGLQLGMTEQEVANGLPELPDELVGTVRELNINRNPHVFDWVKEKCIQPPPPDHAAITCYFSKPSTYAPQIVVLRTPQCPTW